jgi:hypothetical protein
MYKNSILILIFLFSFQAISAQKIFYSEKLNDRVDYTRNYIIGKVRNNIIVLKYGESFKKAELLIYDYNMHFKGAVPFDIINSGVLARVDFVNGGNVFDAIIQYYTANNFYCKIARFNDEGQLVTAIQTVDSIRTKKQNDAEIYHIVKSENNEQVILMRAFTGIKPNCLQLEYKFINNRFKIDKEKKYLVPFSDATQLSPFYLNNSGDLLFCEFIPGSNAQNAILFYKIPKDNDTAINSVQFISSNTPTQLTITVDNNKKQYLVNGLLYKMSNEDFLFSRTFTQSIYSCLFTDDLTIKGKDTTVQIQQLNGLETITANKTFFFNNVNTGNNSDYYISCGGFKSSYLYQINFDTASQTYSTSQSNFETIRSPYGGTERSTYGDIGTSSGLSLRPSNNELMRVNSNTLGQPTNPIYYNGNQIRRENIIQPGNISQSYSGRRVSTEQPKNFKGTDQKVLLLIMRVTTENKLEWVRILNDNIITDFYSISNISQGMSAKNLHFIFSEPIARKKMAINELVVSKTGEHYTKAIVLNDLHYDIQLDKGVQIDDKSMVFPCSVKDRWGFVRIEFD